MSGGLIRVPPVDRGSRDLRALLRNDRFHGDVDDDPESAQDGEAWIRRDLEPPQLRARIDGATFFIDFTAVP